VTQGEGEVWQGHKAFRRIFHILFLYAPAKCPVPLLLMYILFWWWEGTTFTRTFDNGRKLPGCRAM